MSDSTKIASKRGRKPVKGGEFVCVVCDNSLGFQTKKELTDHTNKVHRFVQCGGCEPKKIITWSLPEDVTNLGGTETTPNCDNHNQTDITTAGTDEVESQNENVDEEDEVDVNLDEDDNEDFNSSAFSTGIDGTCEVDEALSVEEMKKYDRMRKKRQLEFTEGSPKRKRSDKSARREPKNDGYEMLPIVTREIQVLSESSPIQPTQVLSNVENEGSLIHAMQIQYDQLSICDVDLYWKTITQTSQEQMQTFKTEQVYDLFVNDEMPLPELDVYELIVKFAQAKPCNDETDDYKTFQARFQKQSAVIRFGLMTKEEFDKVDDDGYLDSKHCSSFSYNIKWKRNKTRMTEVPQYFIKPFEARCDKIMTG
ncbi:unnamed protein product [Orchesella dallaii]|uniref:C2H2-type domain-containing protein n=1 Tax=Orchesella dallaii TaxID=48710 RepID=A0ABP1RVS9_9HEXA